MGTSRGLRRWPIWQPRPARSSPGKNRTTEPRRRQVLQTKL
jgi:hypothetical protein